MGTPRLRGESPAAQRLCAAFEAAQHNLLVTNSVPGRGGSEPAVFVRAGGGYEEPWTRDASINAWYAASLLTPRVARDTLLMVCEPTDDGLVVRQDDQWWDQVVWVVAAYHHVLVTGDLEFARLASGIADRTLDIALRERFVESFGLFRGPGLIQDGISGYPEELVDQSAIGESFVLDHPRLHDVMCLSTNVIHAMAFAAAIGLHDVIGTADRRVEFQNRHDTLAEAILRNFWRPSVEQFRYAVAPNPVDPQAIDEFDLQEGVGLALAVLADIITGPPADNLLGNAHREPQGVPLVWPYVQGYTADRPGRHNVMVWPMLGGMWLPAVARTLDADLLGADLSQAVDLVTRSALQFYELYDSRTGAVTGGWQIGREWRSEPDQTWSATALIAGVLDAVVGLRFEVEGLSVRPLLPRQFGAMQLADLRYRGATIDIDIEGAGTPTSITVDGTPVALDAIHVPADAIGHHRIKVQCSQPNSESS